MAMSAVKKIRGQSMIGMGKDVCDISNGQTAKFSWLK